MNLAFAQRCGERLVEWLAPFCERVEVAGSVRRRRPICNDIDIVAISKLTDQKDLFGAVVGQESHALREIKARASSDGWTILRGGPEVVSWLAKGVQVDLFLCTESTWGTVLVCRTGSKEHNIWLATCAKACGGHWVPNAGIYIDGRFYRQTEEEVYAGIGLPALEPQLREAMHLPEAIRRAPLVIGGAAA